MASSSSAKALPLREWLAGARMAGTLAAAALLIRVAGFRKSVRAAWWLADRSPEPPWEARGNRELAEVRAREIAAVAARMPFTPRCLPQSLLLAMLMRRRGIAAELCIGARTGGAFDAHAWIEIDGAAINQTEDVDTAYRCLLRVPTLA